MQWYSAMQGTGVSIESCWRSVFKVAKKNTLKSEAGNQTENCAISR